MKRLKAGSVFMRFSTRMDCIPCEMLFVLHHSCPSIQCWGARSQLQAWHVRDSSHMRLGAYRCVIEPQTVPCACELRTA